MGITFEAIDPESGCNSEWHTNWSGWREIEHYGLHHLTEDGDIMGATEARGVAEQIEADHNASAPFTQGLAAFLRGCGGFQTR